VETSAETAKRVKRRTLSERIEAADEEKKLLVKKAIAECLKRAKIANEMLAMNLLMCDGKFLTGAFSDEERSDLERLIRDARAGISDATDIYAKHA